MSGITAKDVHWLAGFLDGEGYFGKKGRSIAMSVSQKDEWHIRKVQSLIGGKAYHRPNASGAWYWRLDIGGPRAAGVMMTIYTLMSPRRQERIRECLEFWKRDGRGAHNAVKTHCKHGHEFTPENTKPKAHRNGKVYRECRTCADSKHITQA